MSFSLPLPYSPQVPQSHTYQPFTATLPAPALNPNSVYRHLPETRGATPTHKRGWLEDYGTLTTTPLAMCGSNCPRRVPRLPRGAGHLSETTFPIRPMEPVSGRRRRLPRLLAEIPGVVSLRVILIFKIQAYMSFSSKKTSEFLNTGNPKSSVY